jgi:hypothetical protein
MGSLAVEGSRRARKASGFQCRYELTILIREGLQGEHPPSAVKPALVGTPKTLLKADMGNAVCIRTDRKHLSRLNHTVAVNTLKTRSRPHVIQVSSPFEKETTERAPVIVFS